jgi:tetratricopeptide (TPR) repeat protein
MSEATGSVQIGTFTLTVGGAGGTSVQSGSTAAAEGTGTLAQALVEPEPKEPSKGEVAAEAIEDASGVTAKCERAVTLSKGVSEGKVFDPDQLGAEVGALLDLLEKLDRKGRHKEALRLARALATLLMLLRRWQKLLQTLRTALGLAEKLDDLDAVAWAKNELGALRLAGGDVKGAERDLHQAREIRERIGDRRGLATTNRNLQVLCERLQQMIRKDELVRTGDEPDEEQMRARRPSFLRLLLLAVLVALAFAGGVLAGNAGSSGRPADFHGGGNGGGGGGSNPTTTTPSGTTTSPSGETSTSTTTKPTTNPSKEELLKLEEQKRIEEEQRQAKEKEEEQRRLEEEEQRRREEEPVVR